MRNFWNEVQVWHACFGMERTEAIALILLSLPLHRLSDDCLPGMVPPSLPVFDAVL